MHRTAFSRSRRYLCATSSVLTLLSLCVVGCSPSDTTKDDSVSTSNLMLQARVDQLALATDYIFSDDRFDTGAFNSDVSKLLNQWAATEPSSVAWERDPLIETWPAEFQTVSEVTGLDRLDYFTSDAQYLQQAAWANALVGWLGAEQRIADFRYLFYPTISSLTAEQITRIRGSREPLTELLQIRYGDLERDEATSLATTLQVFDWVVRNIQIEERLSWPTDDEIQLFALTDGNREIPSSLGVPGPGYTLLPEQILKFGRGDAWQRGRVVLLALRQLDIDACWLALPGEDGAPATPWAIAVSLGGHVFLFDPALGLPIPAAGDNGVATLAEVKGDPSLLTRLDVADFELAGRNRSSQPYGVRGDDLDSLILLLDASPPALSKRMKMIQEKLTGRRRLALFEAASEKAERLKQATGIDDARLWRVGVDAILYRKSYEQAIRFRNPRVAQEALMREQLIDFPCPIRRKVQLRDEYDSEGANSMQSQEVVRYDSVRLHTARHRALTGHFDAVSRQDEMGAKRLLLTMRFSDDEIDLLDTDTQVRNYFGVEAAGPGDQDERASALIKSLLREVRSTAAYWLGLAHFDLGDPSSALEWLDQVETFDLRETWLVGTGYNRARALESMLKYDEAVRQLQQSRSSQQAGDAIRARMLLKILEDKTEPASETPAEPDTETPADADTETPAEADVESSESEGSEDVGGASADDESNRSDAVSR